MIHKHSLILWHNFSINKKPHNTGSSLNQSQGFQCTQPPDYHSKQLWHFTIYRDSHLFLPSQNIRQSLIKQPQHFQWLKEKLLPSHGLLISKTVRNCIDFIHPMSTCLFLQAGEIQNFQIILHDENSFQCHLLLAVFNSQMYWEKTNGQCLPHTTVPNFFSHKGSKTVLGNICVSTQQHTGILERDHSKSH